MLVALGCSFNSFDKKACLPRCAVIKRQILQSEGRDGLFLAPGLFFELALKRIMRKLYSVKPSQDERLGETGWSVIIASWEKTGVMQ